MKIGVISDTHIPINARKLPETVREALKKCDLIIHAGDIVELCAIEELEELGETKAVYGNMDSAELRKKLPEKLVINADGKKIGVVHGAGAGHKAIDVAREAFKQKLDIVIFGHSHKSVNEVKDGTLYFNPGSPTDRVFTEYRSYGIIEIDSGEIKAEIIKIKD